MIEYKLNKEKEILLHYANLLNNKIVLNILNKDCVTNKEEVKEIAKLYWCIVDLSIKEDEDGVGKYENMKTWKYGLREFLPLFIFILEIRVMKIFGKMKFHNLYFTRSRMRISRAPVFFGIRDSGPCV